MATSLPRMTSLPLPPTAFSITVLRAIEMFLVMPSESEKEPGTRLMEQARLEPDRFSVSTPTAS